MKLQFFFLILTFNQRKAILRNLHRWLKQRDAKRKFTVYEQCMHLKILKMGSTVLFTHLKIILLHCFQFSVSATISSIQIDPSKNKREKKRFLFLSILFFSRFFLLLYVTYLPGNWCLIKIKITIRIKTKWNTRLRCK